MCFSELFADFASALEAWDPLQEIPTSERPIADFYTGMVTSMISRLNRLAMALSQVDKPGQTVIGNNEALNGQSANVTFHPATMVLDLSVPFFQQPAPLQEELQSVRFSAIYP